MITPLPVQLLRLVLITDRHQLKHAEGVDPMDLLLSYVEAALSGGVTAVQVRERDLPATELYNLCARLRLLTQNRALLIVNDRLDIALAVAADGVHLGEKSLPVAVARKLVPPGF